MQSCAVMILCIMHDGNTAPHNNPGIITPNYYYFIVLQDPQRKEI